MRVALILTTAVCIGCGGPGTTLSTDAIEQSSAERPGLTSGLTYLAAEAKAGRFSGSAAVRVNGEVVLEAAYGPRDIAAGSDNTVETRFRIGSITKQFTAAAIMILADRRQLALQDSVARHLSDLPTVWRGLTLHQLLTHTSGLMHSWDLDELVSTFHRERTPRETIDLFRHEPLLFTPGTRFHYSGLGYFLLARVIEERAGIPYDRFLQQEIFEPAGMSASGVEAAQGGSQYAHGYTRPIDGDLRPATPIYYPSLRGGGHLHSTVRDLLAWDRALTTRQLTSPSSFNQMVQPERQGFGYGWRIDTDETGLTRYHHSGGLYGFRSNIIRIEERDLCVIVLSNDETAEVGRISQQLVTLALAHQPQ